MGAGGVSLSSLLFFFFFFKKGNSLSLSFSFRCCCSFCFVAPLPHLTSDDVDKALQNSPRLMHARNTGNAGPAPSPRTSRRRARAACVRGGMRDARCIGASGRQETERDGRGPAACRRLCAEVPRPKGGGRPSASAPHPRFPPHHRPPDRGSLLARCADLPLATSSARVCWVPAGWCSSLGTRRADR